jgi:alkyl hydroperoxide reductase subunit AhpF
VTSAMATASSFDSGGSTGKGTTISCTRSQFDVLVVLASPAQDIAATAIAATQHRVRRGEARYRIVWPTTY